MLILWLGVLFTDIRICAYKYPNKSISWLATHTGTDPGVIASKEVMPHLHNAKMKMLTIPFFSTSQYAAHFAFLYGINE